MNAQFQREEQIFLRAIEIERGAERDAFLAEACGEDAALRQAVDELLDAHESPPTLLAAAGSSGREDGLRRDGEPAITEGPGTSIGPYRLLEQIGEGGFGVVFMAEQREPMVRRVALKIIKPGMDSRDVVARFEAERQALAMMDHPNIAKVFDAGTTETGRPYFAMELVKGIPLTKFCDEQKLDTDKRLELFLDVCSAVSHAHQKGIIHRDLKPSNILVTLHADKAVPKVIDFGIAKATQQQLTEKTLFTRFGQMVGTPVYMSPEQAALSGLDIDTRSDIYALGVLLYELLVGKPPFDPKSLLSAGYDEMRRIIREEDPPRPSTRLATLDDKERTAVTSAHGADLGKLRALVRGDLDWIVMKAIEKDRSRRYETANGLALDIGRHLRDEVVSAGPPTTRYRLAKFMRRNRVAVAFAATVTVLLVAGVIVASVLAVRAMNAEKTAMRQAERARDAERLAKEEAKVGDTLAEFFTDDVVVRAFQGGTFTLTNLLAAMSEAIAGLERLDDQPLVQAGGYLFLSRLYAGWLMDEQALDYARRSFTIYRGKLGLAHEKTLAAAAVYVKQLLVEWQLAEAQNVLGQVVEPGQAAHGPAHRRVRELLALQARHADAESQAQRAEHLPALRQALEDTPTEVEKWTQLSAAHKILSEIAHREGREEEAVRHFICATSLAAVHNNAGGIWNECHISWGPFRSALIREGLIRASWENSGTLILDHGVEELLDDLELSSEPKEIARAVFLERCGRREKALPVFEAVVESAPDRHLLRHAWALMLERSKQPDRAVEEMRRALHDAGRQNDHERVQWYAANWNRLRKQVGLPLDAHRFLRSDPLIDPNTKRCYARLEVPLPWNDAAQACRELGGRLAVVTSREANTLLTEAFGADHVCWLGASDHETESQWQWADGTPLEFSNWSQDEPSSSAAADYLAFGHRDPLVLKSVSFPWTHDGWCALPGKGTFPGNLDSNRMLRVVITFPLCEWVSEATYEAGVAGDQPQPDDSEPTGDE